MKCLFIFLGLINAVQLYSQDIDVYTRDSTRISNSKIDVFELITAADERMINTIALPFANFSVRDVRFDTAFIGVKIRNLFLSTDVSYGKISLLNGTSAALTNYLNNHPAFMFTPAGSTLTCYIKELRITQVDSLN